MEVPPVSAEPAATEVTRAKDLLLDETFGDFPFVGQAALAHAVAAVLTPFVRDLIDGPTPLHMIDAPAKGTGKSKLGKAIATISDGVGVGEMTGVKEGSEWRKRITAVLVSLPNVIMLDNLSGHLAQRASGFGGSRCGPHPHTLDRSTPGTSTTVALPNRALWLGTGNGVTLSDELRRRTVPIRLDAGMEEPHRRPVTSFRHPNLDRWVKENRGELAWACLTLGQAWLAAGRPEGPSSLGSFEAWATVIGGILEVARSTGS